MPYATVTMSLLWPCSIMSKKQSSLCSRAARWCGFFGSIDWANWTSMSLKWIFFLFCFCPFPWNSFREVVLRLGWNESSFLTFIGSTSASHKDKLRGELDSLQDGSISCGRGDINDEVLKEKLGGRPGWDEWEWYGWTEPSGFGVWRGRRIEKRNNQ